MKKSVKGSAIKESKRGPAPDEVTQAEAEDAEMLRKLYYE